MTKREILQQATIRIAAALVKVYDEQADGITPIAERQIADQAVRIAINVMKAESRAEQQLHNDLFE